MLAGQKVEQQCAHLRELPTPKRLLTALDMPASAPLLLPGSITPEGAVPAVMVGPGGIYAAG